MLSSSRYCSALVSGRLFRSGRKSVHPWQSFATVGSGHTTIQSLSTTTAATPKSGASRNTVSMNEIELSLADGMVLRGQRWCTSPQNNNNNNNAIKILALHGWLDNCRSFYHLAPNLLQKLSLQAETPAEFVAIDLPGHGWSSHRPLGGPTAVLSEGSYYIAEAIEQLGWNSNSDSNSDSENDNGNNNGVALIGHSMGGSMAVLYAGIFPEQISHVVSIDIYGPEPRPSHQMANHIRSHVLQRQRGPRPHALYKSLEKAISRRQTAATLNLGGHQYLSQEAATELVTRAMEPVYNQDNADELVGYKFLHDNRLLWASLQYMTQEQILSVLEEVKCPVCIVAGEDGYPFEQDRIDRVVAALKPQVHQTLPGSHHLHADPDTADAVVDAIYGFFCESNCDKEPNGEANSSSTKQKVEDTY